MNIKINSLADIKIKYYLIEYDNMSTGLIVKAPSKKEAILMYMKDSNMLSMIEKEDWKLFRQTLELTERQANNMIGRIRGGIEVRFFN